jgi:SAM-dependent methyltransferase
MDIRGLTMIGDLLISYYGTPTKVLENALVENKVCISATVGVNFNEQFGSSLQPFDLSEYLDKPNEHQLRILSLLLSNNTQKVLDVGAGSGRISIWLQNNGLDVTSCEPDEGAASICLARGLKCVQTNFLSEISGTFDAVILFGGGIPLLNCSEEPDKLIDEFMSSMIKLVKVGGYLCLELVFHNFPGTFEINEKILSVISFYLSGNTTPLSYYAYMNQNEVSQKLKLLGLMEIEKFIVPQIDSDFHISNVCYLLYQK